MLRNGIFFFKAKTQRLNSLFRDYDFIYLYYTYVFASVFILGVFELKHYR